MAFVFRQNGKLHAVMWSNNFHGLDIHWETDPRIWRGVTLPGAAGRLTVADMFGNPREDVKVAGGDVVLDLNEEPTFFFNDGDVLHTHLILKTPKS